MGRRHRAARERRVVVAVAVAYVAVVVFGLVMAVRAVIGLFQ